MGSSPIFRTNKKSAETVGFGALFICLTAHLTALQIFAWLCKFQELCERIIDRLRSPLVVPCQLVAVHPEGVHLKEDLSLHRMAVPLNVNRSYLSSLFRRQTGRKLTDYVISARIEYAANLILYSQFSVTAAAAAVGYSDVSYFTRLFKRVLGTTPAQYCKSALLSDRPD